METISQLQLPVTPYTTGEFRQFGERIRRHLILWATHLGDDVAAAAGMTVQAIGEGKVVWCEMRLGSEAKRDWGGVVIIRHDRGGRNKEAGMKETSAEATFYSIYGHITDLEVVRGQKVERGQQLGVVAPALTPENGWWRRAHLHFAIYTGPWKEQILPGYARPDDWLRPGATRRTRLAWWHDPRQFIATYNESA